MANSKSQKTADTWVVVAFSVLCLLIAVFLVFTFITAGGQTSELVQDKAVAEVLSDYFDKKPAQITAEDLASVQYFSFTGGNSLSLGGADAIAEIESEEATEESTSVKSFSISADFDDFNAVLALFPNLKYFSAPSVSSRYFSKIDQLSACKDLQYLTLTSAKLSSLEGLDSFTNLKSLTLDKVALSEEDTARIGKLPALTELSVSECGIKDLAFASSLASLESLYAGSNEISDVSPLKELKSLVTLSLENNEGITDVEALSGLTELKSLNLQNTGVKDWSVLDAIKENCTITGAPEEETKTEEEAQTSTTEEPKTEEKNTEEAVTNEPETKEKTTSEN